MKLFKKEFKITQLLNNRNEFTVVEIFYVLGISIYFTEYGVDGKSADIPFKLLSSAKNLKKELETQEIFDNYKRINILYWIVFMLITSLITWGAFH